MNPPLSMNSVQHPWKCWTQILAYYLLLFCIIVGLLSRYLPGFLPFVLVPLLWLCTRPSFPLKPKLPEQEFSRVEWWLWLGGAGVCGLVLLGYAYGAGFRGTLKLFQAFAIGVATWSFIFLACRDCRRARWNPT